jgi:hypothetical protein
MSSCCSIPHLVGGFKHEFDFPFHIWDVILPIHELVFFKMVIAPPTRLWLPTYCELCEKWSSIFSPRNIMLETGCFRIESLHLGFHGTLQRVTSSWRGGPFETWPWQRRPSVAGIASNDDIKSHILIYGNIQNPYNVSFINSLSFILCP